MSTGLKKIARASTERRKIREIHGSSRRTGIMRTVMRGVVGVGVRLRAAAREYCLDSSLSPNLPPLPPQKTAFKETAAAAEAAIRENGFPALGEKRPERRRLPFSTLCVSRINENPRHTYIWISFFLSFHVGRPADYYYPRVFLLHVEIYRAGGRIFIRYTTE